METDFVLPKTHAQQHSFRRRGVCRVDEHIQIRHLPVTELRVQLLQPAALHRHQVDSGIRQIPDDVIALLKLDDALRQELIGPLLPLRPHRVRAVAARGGKSTEDKRLHTVAFRKIKQLPQGYPFRDRRNRLLLQQCPYQADGIISGLRHGVP